MEDNKTSIELPTVINEDCWFYKDNEELCKPHLGKPYISNSSVDSYLNFREDFIKNKFAKIETPDGIYATFGSYVGSALEHGEFPEENPHGFIGQENLDLKTLRVEGAEYEKMILIDMETFVIIGFLDQYIEENNKAKILDYKTGGKNKESKYQGDEYIQVILYAHEIESRGKEIEQTGVYFIRRENSHVSPPLKIGKDQFYIPLEYNEERVNYALNVVTKIVKEISDSYKVYKKYFLN